MKDPNLRRCSHAARGVWIDMLCLMFECSQRGVLITGNSPWSREDAAAAVGGNADVALSSISELVAKCVCKVRESDGALYSKRMVDDEAKRLANVKRVRSHREKWKCNGAVMPLSEDEDEDHKPKLQKHSPAEEIYELYPRKVARVAAVKAINAVLAASEPEMKARLLERTRAYAEAVAKWSPADRQFVPHPATWFNRGSFDDDPSTWVRQSPAAVVSAPVRMGQNLTEGAA